MKLEIAGHVVETTEDHPFWNETDMQWQRADELDAGDCVRTAGGGATAKVGGIAGVPDRPAQAFNLTVEGIHTYYVMAGNTPILVHNSGCALMPLHVLG